MKVMMIGMPKSGTWSMMAALRRCGMELQPVDYREYVKRRRLDIRPGHFVFEAGIDQYWHHAHDPDVKFILPIRSLDKWLESVRRNWPNTDAMPAHKLAKHVELMGVTEFDATYLARRYVAHADQAEAFLSNPGRLLVHWTGRDGYRELCTFLGVDLVDDPWPHLHQAVAR